MAGSRIATVILLAKAIDNANRINELSRAQEKAVSLDIAACHKNGPCLIDDLDAYRQFVIFSFT